MPSVRIDKWLWAARFFKTRALAARACEVRVGDKLRITNDGGDFHVDVLLLSEARGPAAVAQTLYRETEESKEARLKAAAERKAAMQFEPMPTGRPSKRDRRKIIQFRGRG
jgi:ribosome-associated heat shock protein Hsp15